MAEPELEDKSPDSQSSAPVLFPLCYICFRAPDMDPNAPSGIDSHGAQARPSDSILRDKI